MTTTDIDLGLVTAYGYAKSKGYTGTEEQFKTDLANIANKQDKIPSTAVSDVSSSALQVVGNQKIDYNALAKAIVEQYSASELCGASQSIKAALDGLNNTLINLNPLEEAVNAIYSQGRTGKIWKTKIYKFASNTTSAGTREGASAGLTCTPSTDTTEGTDDYEQYMVFQWTNCNYIRDDDGTARVTALEGMDSYKTSGAVDVGVIAPMFWWKAEDSADGTYTEWMLSDTPHPELGLYPWCEGVKADGTVLPYYIGSKYNSITASDGLLRSQPGSYPAYNQSYNNMITNYQKKGKGYWGAGDCRNSYQQIMMIIKYATKNSQMVFRGCVDYDTQTAVALAESNVKRVLVASQGSFIAGGCVSVGDKGSNSSTDRQNAYMNNIADRVVVKSIETVTVSGTSYVALNLDISNTITTTSTTYVSTMPQWTGTTDVVLGHHDGSPVSNTDSKHVYRIMGREYGNGQGFIGSDVVYNLTSSARQQYCFKKGVAHASNSNTGATLVGELPLNNASDYWQGDFEIDPDTGASRPISVGAGDSVGVGDYTWNGGTETGLREDYRFGNLGFGSAAGFSYVGLGAVLGNANWYYGSGD